MSKFKIIAGTHVERKDGKLVRRYKAGEVVKSDLPLDEMFKNKFEKVGRTSSVKEPDQDVQEPAQDAPDAPETEDEGEDTPDADETPDGDPADSQDDDEITLKAVHKGAGRWDVLKVINGELTEETVNDEFLKKDDAKALAAAGYIGEE